MSNSRPKPNPPSVFPVLFVSCLVLLGVAYLVMDRLGYPPGYILLVAPLLLPLLPAEIKHALDRRKVCSNIITDFISRGQDVDTDYERILARMRRPGLSPQTVTTGSDDKDGPISWN